jgi:SAM-dependent methyltransferase
MEAIGRKPFQGVTNIIRFNWHFFVIAMVVMVTLVVVSFWMGQYQPVILGATFLIFSGILFSLMISFYVYDFSNLYALNWLDTITIAGTQHIANINAGFDETSALLASRYATAKLAVFDFYDKDKHTEVSIARARKLYAPYPGTQCIDTNAFPVANASIDFIFSTFSLHEIRNSAERVCFLKQLRESLKPDGRIVITEHLRDFPNFIAYTAGFFHFFSRKEWQSNFYASGLTIEREIKFTPFVSIFILMKK